MTKVLRHHKIAPINDRYEVEVWADDGNDHVTLYISGPGDLTYVELQPAEARALAALLVMAAGQKETTNGN